MDRHNPQKWISFRSAPTAVNVFSLGALGATIAPALDGALFHGHRLNDLPAAADDPLLVILATDMEPGEPWIFSRDYVGDIGIVQTVGQSVRISQAVAASSAVPPVLGPIRFIFSKNAIPPHNTDVPCSSDTSEAACKVAKALVTGSNRERSFHADSASLMDGGVLDNLGIMVCAQADLNLVSDAGVPPWATPEKHYETWPSVIARVVDLYHAAKMDRDYVEHCKYPGTKDHAICWRLEEMPYLPQFGIPQDAYRKIEMDSYLDTRFAALSRKTQCAVMTAGYLTAAASLAKSGWEGVMSKAVLPCPDLW